MNREYEFVFKGFNPSREEYDGTILTLANGVIGVRGEIELYPSKYGFFASGIYDYTPIFYREIVNFPRVNGLYIKVNSKPILLANCDNLNLTRRLNISQGILYTSLECRFGKAELSYNSLRLVHRKRRNILLQHSRINLKNSEKLSIETPVELDKVNPLIPANIYIKHYEVVDMDIGGDYTSLLLKTIDNRYKVAIASKTIVLGHVEHVDKYALTDKVVEVYDVDFKNMPIEVTRIVSISTSRETEDPLDKAVGELEKAVRDGRDLLVAEHISSWKSLWDNIKLRIDGDVEVEEKLLFYAFHLLQLVDDEQEYIMIPARGLHGLGYRGHVFWDTDIYTLPFYIAFTPEAARRILMYRYRILDKARLNARKNGYKGAQYPWESCDDGIEATPREIPLDVLGENRIRILTGDMEHHITADVAYAVHLYYEFTGDEEFLLNYGLEILFETARFWASRVEYDDDKKAYVIRNVMGPDEYHPSVDNSFYTNVMARKNLELAVKYYELALEKGNKWIDKVIEIGVTSEEVAYWRKIVNNIFIPCKNNGFCEEFEGYSNLRNMTTKTKGLGIVKVGEKFLELKDTQIIKQADVVAALFLLYDEFPKHVVEVNYKYYLPRTTHESSLSLPMYAGLAAKLGRIDEAYKLFKLALKTDLEDLYGNTSDGFHVATAGGLWTTLLLGFLGIKASSGKLVKIEPKLPEHWKSVELNISIGGRKLHLRVRKNSVQVDDKSRGEAKRIE